MTQVLFLITDTVVVFLSIVELLMLARVIVSLFASEDSTLNMFLYFVTEPCVIPFRLLFDRFESVREFPIDIPFIMAVFSLSLVRSLLPMIVL